MVDVDLRLLLHHEANAVRDAVAEACGLEPRAVRVSATHSHSSPVTNELGGWLREGREHIAPYRERVVASSAAAAREACARLVPVAANVATAICPLAVNRRERLPSGELRVGYNEQGPADQTVRVLRLDGPDADPVAIIVGYAAHPTILGGANRLITPEYPGIVKRVVEDTVGGRCLFLQGAAGDVGTREALVADIESYHRQGRWLGHAAASAAVWASTRTRRPVSRSAQHKGTWLAGHDHEPVADVRPTLALAVRQVELPVRPGLGDPGMLRDEAQRMADELHAARQAGMDDAANRLLTTSTKWMFMQAERAGAVAGRDVFPIEVHGVRIGPAGFVGLPLELFAETGSAICDRSPFTPTFVSGYTNGYRNYVPTKQAWQEGGYEVDTASFTDAASTLIEKAALDVLSELASAA